MNLECCTLDFWADVADFSELLSLCEKKEIQMTWPPADTCRIIDLISFSRHFFFLSLSHQRIREYAHFHDSPSDGTFRFKFWWPSSILAEIAPPSGESTSDVTFNMKKAAHQCCIHRWRYCRFHHNHPANGRVKGAWEQPYLRLNHHCKTQESELTTHSLLILTRYFL